MFFRQVWTLVWKNLLIVLFRHPITTPLRAFLLPVVFSWVELLCYQSGRLANIYSSFVSIYYCKIAFATWYI